MDGFDNLSELQNPEKSFWTVFWKNNFESEKCINENKLENSDVQIMHGTESFLGDMKHSHLPWAVAIRN